MRMLGSATGMAIAGTLYAQQQAARLSNLVGQGIAADLTEKLSVVGAFQNVIFLGAMIGVVSIFTSFFTGNRLIPRVITETPGEESEPVLEE